MVEIVEALLSEGREVARGGGREQGEHDSHVSRASWRGTTWCARSFASDFRGAIQT